MCALKLILLSLYIKSIQGMQIRGEYDLRQLCNLWSKFAIFDPLFYQFFENSGISFCSYQFRPIF